MTRRALVAGGLSSLATLLLLVLAAGDVGLREPTLDAGAPAQAGPTVVGSGLLAAPSPPRSAPSGRTAAGAPVAGQTTCRALPEAGPSPVTVEALLAAAADDDGPRDRALGHLTEHARAAVAAGSLSSLDLIDALAALDDPPRVDAVARALAQVAPEPEAIDPILARASAAAEPALRRAAIAHLGAARDPAGRVDRALADLAAGEPDTALALAAVEALAAGGRFDQLLDVAMRSSDPYVRATSLARLDTGDAIGEPIDRLTRLLADPSRDVRHASAGALGRVGALGRRSALAALERAHAGEFDLAVRGAIVSALVRAGRTEAVPFLLRLDEEDPELARRIAATVRALEAGELDFHRIELKVRATEW